MSKSVTRLFTQFQPEHYDLELVPDIQNMRFSGTVTITGNKVGRPAKRLSFHQKDLKVGEVKVVRHDKKGDRPLSVDRINNHSSYDELRLHFTEMVYPGRYTLTMNFEGKLQDSMHGIYVSHYQLNGREKTVLSTQFESHHAREAFPCIDEPEAKATFDLTLMTPEDEVVLSNMNPKKSSTNNKQHKTVFETTPKMSTYLLAFVIGDLQNKSARTNDGVDVRVWATKAQPAASLDYALDVAKRSVEFFNDYYGVPYPLPKCDHVAIPDFSSAAMENWGLITYREMALLADPKTSSQSNREWISEVISHEVSHQWFGNLVTMKWWDDLWLNESFANVMGYMAPDNLFPDWNIWDNFINESALAAIRRDSIAGVQSVKTSVNHPDEISTLFDPSIVYAKGGRLLNMLRNYIGEDDFRKGLKAYFIKHAYGNTTGDDLWEALGAASKKDIAAFMDPWLNRSGFPVVTVTQKDKHIDITQSHFLLDPDKADKSRVWPVPLLSRNSQVPILLDERSTSASLKSDDFVTINEGAMGHYIVDYSEPEHMEAIAKLVESQELAGAERLMLLSDSSMLARGGIQSFDTTLKLLEHYGDEDNESVWGIITLILADLRRFIDSAPELEPAIKTHIRQLINKQYLRLGWHEKKGEASSDTKLRATILGLGVYAEHQKITESALESFERYKTDSSIVPSELRAIVLGAAVRTSAKGAFGYLLKLEEDTNNVDLKQDLMNALTLTRKPEDIEILLDRLKDSKKVRLHDVDHWLVNLLRNRYTQEQAWKWLRDNWKWIEKAFGGDKSYDNYPRYAASALNTRKRLKEYKEFFEPLLDNVSLRRNINMGIEELTNRITWLERDLPSVKSYLQN